MHLPRASTITTTTTPNFSDAQASGAGGATNSFGSFRTDRHAVPSGLTLVPAYGDYAYRFQAAVPRMRPQLTNLATCNVTASQTHFNRDPLAFIEATPRQLPCIFPYDDLTIATHIYIVYYENYIRIH